MSYFVFVDFDSRQEKRKESFSRRRSEHSATDIDYINDRYCSGTSYVTPQCHNPEYLREKNTHNANCPISVCFFIRRISPISQTPRQMMRSHSMFSLKLGARDPPRDLLSFCFSCREHVDSR